MSPISAANPGADPGADPGPIPRRALLAALAAGAPFRAAANDEPDAARLLVPGPDGSALVVWAQRLAARLATRSPAGIRLEMVLLGGLDGVTAANRFATAASPDGRSLLLLPGLAGQARLVGDKRAQFDPTGWLPVCAAAQPAWLAARRPLPRGPIGAPLRLGLVAPEHPTSAVVLVLDLLGIAAVPVFGLAPAAAEAALAQGEVDAAVLAGTDAPARLASMGALPWFALDDTARGVMAPGTAPGMEPVPGLAEAVAATAPRSLLGALEAAAAAVQLQAALVLPALTPADLVALWRGAAQRWIEEEARAVPASGSNLLDAMQAAAMLGALAAPPAAMQAYRDWLRQRLGWRAG